jgi:hypothetical protein
MIAAFACLLGPACDQVAGSPERLIPPGDPEHVDLEQPEAAGECQSTSECQHSCVHGCVPLAGGPVTCPADPPPLPERLADATCLCDGDLRCAWYPTPEE